MATRIDLVNVVNLKPQRRDECGTSSEQGIQLHSPKPTERFTRFTRFTTDQASEIRMPHVNQPNVEVHRESITFARVQPISHRRRQLPEEVVTQMQKVSTVVVQRQEQATLGRTSITKVSDASETGAYRSVTGVTPETG